MKEIVKYNNEFNSVSLCEFTAIELDILHSLFLTLKDEGSNELILSFSKLRKIMNYSQRSNTKLINEIMGFEKKVAALGLETLSADDDKNSFTFEKKYLFKEFVVRKEEDGTGFIKFVVHEDYVYLFNDLINWTRFSISEYVNLRSKHSKNIYRLLKQFRTTGHVTIGKSALLAQLGINELTPESDLTKRVFTPVVKELSKYFIGLKVKKNRGSGKGGKITSYTFTFQRQLNNANDLN